MLTRTCTVCKRELPLADFPLQRDKKSGRAWRLGCCRACKNAKIKACREQAKAEGRPYHKNGGNNRSRTPQQRRAHRQVESALESGRLRAGEVCGLCGQRPAPGERLDAHHADYSRPLDVTWLCRSCHTAIHNMLPTLGQHKGEAIRP